MIQPQCHMNCPDLLIFTDRCDICMLLVLLVLTHGVSFLPWQHQTGIWRHLVALLQTAAAPTDDVTALPAS